MKSPLKVYNPRAGLMRDNDYMASTIIMLEYRTANSGSVCMTLYTVESLMIGSLYVAAIPPYNVTIL